MTTESSGTSDVGVVDPKLRCRLILLLIIDHSQLVTSCLGLAFGLILNLSGDFISFWQIGLT